MRATSLSRVLLGFTAVHIFSAVDVYAAAGSCESVVALRLPKTSVATQSVAESNYSPSPEVARMPVAAFCRVVGTSQPASGSQIGFEVWLPKKDWNGRLKMF